MGRRGRRVRCRVGLGNRQTLSIVSQRHAHGSPPSCESTCTPRPISMSPGAGVAAAPRSIAVCSYLVPTCWVKSAMGCCTRQLTAALMPEQVMPEQGIRAMFAHFGVPLTPIFSPQPQHSKVRHGRPTLAASRFRHPSAKHDHRIPHIYSRQGRQAHSPWLPT